MKTQNNKTENRNNQLEKVLLRSAAVIVSFVLISFTVSAQGFWKQLLTNNSFGKMAQLMVEDSNVDFSADASAATNAGLVEAENSYFYFDQAVDKPLEVEEWMTDDAYFGAFNHIFEPVVEKSLELENWMMDEDHFNSRYAVVQDKPLEIEDWMTNDSHWKL